jgi:exoribonuclease R
LTIPYHERSADDGIQDLASKLRKKRQEAGAMMQKKIKVSFKLGEEGKPVDCEAGERNDANVLVEEVSSLGTSFRS